MEQNFVTQVPHIIFKTRVRDETIAGDNPYRWQDVTTDEIFKGKRIAILAVPGAFTPTCSDSHLPSFENNYESLRNNGIDEVYCIAVNDAFVMFQWAKHLNIKNVKMLPDGSGKFTSGMGMLVQKDDIGFGQRSWRYSMIVNDGVVEKMFAEEGKCDNCDHDPYDVSSGEHMLAYVQGN